MPHDTQYPKEHTDTYKSIRALDWIDTQKAEGILNRGKAYNGRENDRKADESAKPKQDFGDRIGKFHF